MAHCLLAWELGAGLGHVVPLSLLTRVLQARGHRVTLALSRPGQIAALPWETKAAILEAPFHRRATPVTPAISYADVLRQCGYGNAGQALALHHAWRTILAAQAPDIVIADHAPSALLTAYVTGIPGIAVGSGFTVPPPVDAAPGFQRWMPPRPDRLAAYEEQALAAINAVCISGGAAPLAHSGALIGNIPPLLKTFIECDIYRRPADALYCGPVYGEIGRRPAHWLSSKRPRIALYLSPRFAGHRALINALQDSGASVLSHVGGEGEPLDLAWAARHADAVLCHGGIGTSGLALAIGCPLIILPMQMEQLVLSDRLAQQDLATIIRPDQPPDAVAKAVLRIIREGSATRRAAAFAARYPEASVDGALNRAADVIEGALSQDKKDAAKTRNGEDTAG